MKVLFLHLPKTAGQSVHQYLIDTFSTENVCPARVNDQYSSLTNEEISSYQVYSGHIDWSRFDFLETRPFTFTILRDPMDRLLSFYFYLREQAEIFESRGELNGMPGVKAAKENTPYEFFVSLKNEHRTFIDQNIDNLYTFYFAGREYAARNVLRPLTGNGKCIRFEYNLVDIAMMNIKSELVHVYGINEWNATLQKDLESHALNTTGIVNGEYVINCGRTDQSSRLALLRELGADDEVIEKIHSMCKLDYELIDRLGLRDRL